MSQHEESSDSDRTSRNILTASKLQLAAALILSSSAAMSAANDVQARQGEQPRFGFDAFWAEIESVYDQLGLPHQDGVVLFWKLFED